jgi:uncharacterized OsmC-like protein
MTTEDKLYTFDVVWEADTRTTDGLRTETRVRQTSIGDHPEFTILTDEVSYPHGGDQTAPAPLAYFAAGLATCLVTQIRAVAKKLRTDVRGVKVNARCMWKAEARGRAPYVGAPVGFALDVEIDCDQDRDAQRELLNLAKKACFFEQTLARANTIDHRLKIDDAWVDA